jgi:hypothetical protein
VTGEVPLRLVNGITASTAYQTIASEVDILLLLLRT